jgi:hypothetical protein
MSWTTTLHAHPPVAILASFSQLPIPSFLLPRRLSRTGAALPPQPPHGSDRGRLHFSDRPRQGGRAEQEGGPRGDRSGEPAEAVPGRRFHQVRKRCMRVDAEGWKCGKAAGGGRSPGECGPSASTDSSHPCISFYLLSHSSSKHNACPRLILAHIIYLWPPGPSCTRPFRASWPAPAPSPPPPSAPR